LNYKISIDCGGTFTDGYLTYGSEQIIAKVLTTPHDLAICFSNLLDELAKLIDVPLTGLLANTESVRFSNTIGTNTILQHSGPKLGLVLSQGFKNRYIKESYAVGQGFVREDMIEEILEEVDVSGKVKITPLEDHVLKIVERLLDDGARCIVIGFTNAGINTANEQTFRSIVEQNYPKHLLGAVPLFLSSEISKRPNDVMRINTALINAYLHRNMAYFLYKAEDHIRKNCYTKNLLIGHGNGAVARVAKTLAINSCDSGPAAAVVGAAKIASLYGIDKLITADMGGTSLDIATLENGIPRFQNQVDIDGFRYYVLSSSVTSLAAGGNSIAYVKKSGLRVGPKSAGSSPGPACFKSGGMEPTVIDADLVLGLINAECLLGGRIKVDVDAAIKSIKKYIADPMRISIEEAAWQIRTTIDDKIAVLLKDLIKQKGLIPEEITLLAFGGAGPSHCCFFAEKVGIKKIIVCKQAPVFSAFGLDKASISHFYEIVKENGGYSTEIEQGKSKITCDIKAEGFIKEQVHYHFWPVLKKKKFSERKQMESEIDYSENIEALFLEASGEVYSWSPVIYPDAGEDYSNALSSWRLVYWKDEFIGTPIFNRDLLKTGNKISGPAIIEADATTYIIPHKWNLFIDKYANAFISKEG